MQFFNQISIDILPLYLLLDVNFNFHSSPFSFDHKCLVFKVVKVLAALVYMSPVILALRFPNQLVKWFVLNCTITFEELLDIKKQVLG